jgi:hypothetical protein
LERRRQRKTRRLCRSRRPQIPAKYREHRPAGQRSTGEPGLHITRRIENRTRRNKRLGHSAASHKQEWQCPEKTHRKGHRIKLQSKKDFGLRGSTYTPQSQASTKVYTSTLTNWSEITLPAAIRLNSVTTPLAIGSSYAGFDILWPPKPPDSQILKSGECS